MADTSVVPELSAFRPEAWRGGPGGWRVSQTRTGEWWAVSPDGEPQVLRGVHGVRPVPGWGGQAAIVRLGEWGFNLLGLDSDPGFWGRGIPHLVSLDLRRSATLSIRTGGALLPDVFDPSWAEYCASRLAALNTGRGLFGYASDDTLGWAQPSPGRQPTRPTLLQLCLALDPRFAAYHAAWEFVLAPHGGELAALSRAWDVALPNKETLRQLTLEEVPLVTSGYLRDHARFTREFAQRYFGAAAAAVRRADPDRLFLGTPMRHDLPDTILEAARAHTDVLLVKSHIDSGGGPILLVDFSWTALAEPVDPAQPDGLSRLERMHRRGRAALEDALAQPENIGYMWRAFADGDRLEDAPFGEGLIYTDGTIAHEHVQPLSAVNAAAAKRSLRKPAVARD